jgi:hypothetical protein
MQQLTHGNESGSEASQLHLLRILSEVETGEAEGNELFRIAQDPSRLWPIRSWAWHAYAKSTGCRAALLMEAARGESDRNVRRAIVATTKSRGMAGRRQKSFLRHVGRHFSESHFTAEWIRHAA